MGYLLYNDSFAKVAEAKKFDEIINYAIDNDILSLMNLIVPTEKIARRLEDKIITLYFEKYKKPTETPNIFTLQKFAEKLLNELSKDENLKKINDSDKMVLFGEAASTTNFKFYKKNKNDISWRVLDKLATVICGLKEDGIHPEKMGERLSDSNDNKLPLSNENKYRDIYNLYLEFNKLLGNKYYIPEDIFNLLNSRANKKGNPVTCPFDHLFEDRSFIHIEGFSEFKQPESEFIRSFINSKMPVTIRIDYILDKESKTLNGPLFGNFEETIVNLCNGGYKIMDDFQGNKDDIPSFLRRWLFNTEEKKEFSELSNFISILEASNLLDEVHIIGKLVKWLNFKDGVKLSDICIVSRTADTYSGLFRDIFAEYKIPVNITDRYELSTANSVNSIFAVLDMIAEDFYYEDVFKVLNSRYFTFKNASQIELDKASIIDFSKKLRIKGGKRNGRKDVWIKSFDNKLNAIDKQLKFLKDDENEYMSVRALIAESVAIKKIREEFQLFLSYFDFSAALLSAEEFRNLIKEKIISKLGMWQNLDSIASSKPTDGNPMEYMFFLESIEKDVASLNQFQIVLDETCNVLSDRYPQQKFGFAELVEKLRLSVLGGKYQIKEKRNYGVTITSIEQIRQLPFKVAILCGAVDGQFPMLYRPDIFLGDDIPEAEDRHQCSERVLFYQFLTNNPESFKSKNKRIYITYPKFENTEQIVRSPFIDALLRISNLEKDNKIYNIPQLRLKKSNSDLNDEIIKIQLAESSFCFTITSQSEYDSLIGSKLKINLKNQDVSNDKLIEIIENDDSKNLDFLKEKLRILFSGNPDKFDWNSFDNSEEIVDKMIKSRIYSASELESYAACPYNFFLKYIIRVPEPVKLELDMTALESGTVYHSILYRFFMNLKSAFENHNYIPACKSKILNKTLLRVELDEANHLENLELLKTIAETELIPIRYPHPFFQIFENELFGSGNKKGLLEIWLLSEYSRKKISPFNEFSPSQFEFCFGMKAPDNQAAVTPAVELSKELTLKGKIDRIELDKDFQAFIIADYKSSANSAKSRTSMLDGTSLQLPLYLAAAKKLLKDFFELDTEAAGAVYYILKPVYDIKKKEYSSYKLIHSERNFILDNLIESSILFAESYINRIKQGEFPAKPRNKKTCEYCSFKSICRIGAKA